MPNQIGDMCRTGICHSPLRESAMLMRKVRALRCSPLSCRSLLAGAVWGPPSIQGRTARGPPSAAHMHLVYGRHVSADRGWFTHIQHAAMPASSVRL